MADLVIGFGGGSKRKDLRDWAKKDDEAPAEESPKVNLGEKRLTYLAEKAMSGSPEDFVKAVKAIVESCKGEPAAAEDDETEVEG
jgi:hypothetical protein